MCKTKNNIFFLVDNIYGMEDSAIKYFFSVDGSDKRGVQFAKALETGKINELIQVKNFI